MPKIILDRGPRSARIVIIGEAPGKREWEEGAPFVGPSGWQLDQWMRDAGVERGSVYYTNVSRYWPGEFAPRAVKVGLNDFKWLPKEIVNVELQELLGRLARLDDPVVIVPTGNHALAALFGPGRRISDYRGSILSCQIGSRSIKCIPTIHPAATFRRPILARFCIADWRRIMADSQFRLLNIPARQTTIVNDTEFDRFIGELQEHGGPLAIDIECALADGRLQCIAASYSPDRALVIPLDIPGHDAANDPFLRQCWAWASTLCGPINRGNTDPASGLRRVHKVLQNGLFDQFILKQRGGIELTDYVWDTLEMDHALFANDGSDPQAAEDGGDDIKIPMHSLSVLASLYTRQPFYKGDARDGFKFGWSRLEDLWAYNGLDAMVTIEIWQKLHVLMQERGLV